MHEILNTYGSIAGWTGPPARVSEAQIQKEYVVLQSQDLLRVPR